MIATKTRIKRHELDQQWDKMTKELSAVIQKEFPVGAKVRWTYGYKIQHGVVTETVHHTWETRVRVRNTKTNTERRMEATDLEPDECP